MRVLAATMAVLLLVAIWSLAEADPRISRHAAFSQMQEIDDITCCFSHTSRPLPRRMIHSAFRTSNSCSLPSVVLVTRKGMKVCVDPEARWVQAYLRRFELPEY